MVGNEQRTGLQSAGAALHFHLGSVRRMQGPPSQAGPTDVHMGMNTVMLMVSRMPMLLEKLIYLKA